MSSPDIIKRSIESIGLTTFAYFLFSMADILQKYLGTNGYDTHVILLYSSFGSFFLSASMIMLRRGPQGFIPKKSIKLHLLRAAFMVVGSYSIVTSLKLLPLAQFYGVVFSLPFMIAFAAIFIFKEHPGISRWISILLGFLGVLIAANPDFNNLNIGIFWALLAALCIAGSSLTVRKIGKGEFMPIFPFYIHGAIFITNLFLVEEIMLPNNYDLILFLLTSLCLFFAVILLTTAYTMAPLAAVIAPFQYSQILWGVVFGYLIFSEIPDTYTVLGICIIVAAGLYMIWHEYSINKTRPYQGKYLKFR